MTRLGQAAGSGGREHEEQMTAQRPWRMFIALEATEAIRRRADQVRRTWPAHAPQPRWVAPANIHLTIRFLGDVPVDKVGQLVEAMEEAAGPFSCFALNVGGLGVFPNIRRPKVLWLAVTGEVERLARLAAAVDARLEPLGFAPEKRPFRAHLTVGRFKHPKGPVETSLLNETFEPIDYRAGRLVLYRSRLQPGGAVYSQVAAVDLVDSPAAARRD